VNLLGTRLGGLIVVPARGATHRSPVERVAIKRAEISAVLDAVERAWRSLPSDLKEVATAKYRKNMGYKETATRCHVSPATLDRKLQAIRAKVAAELALVPKGVMKVFWTKIGSGLPS
jgi:DNA-directed RNA polymerase specialized sigma24 family protein